MLIKLFMVMLLIASFQSYGAKKECADLLDKFQNIQSEQKQGQSFKNSVKLRKKEDVARQKWWDCENNKIKPKTKKKTKSVKKKKSIKLKKTYKPSFKDAPQVFSSNQQIVVKGRFSGKKQLHWLSYYKRPKECAKPKTTQVFAFCIEDKTKQQNKFEQEFQKNQ